MDVITTIDALRARLAKEKPIGFVPTMGNLHAGHIQLTKIAREHVGATGCVVVSIFVNRLQFGPQEDFSKYPRTFQADCDQCEAAGVDVVFAPNEAELYPVTQDYVVEPPEIQRILEGAVRPGHFRGVATVVLKLFNMVQPQVAVFGKKDYQQSVLLANMVEQLNLPVQMVLAQTTRAADGLALSSRNGYLSATERAEAPTLHQQLKQIVDRLNCGERDFAALEAGMIDVLAQRGWQPDYVSICRRADLGLPTPTEASLVVVAAARLGNTRLLDNIEVSL